MNKIKIIGLAVLFCSGALFASIDVLYDNAKLPSLPLPVAYEHAMTALGSATNQFHCVSANITTTFTSEGEWYFSFYSTNSNVMPKFIAVEFNGKVIFDNGLR